MCDRCWKISTYLEVWGSWPTDVAESRSASSPVSALMRLLMAIDLVLPQWRSQQSLLTRSPATLFPRLLQPSEVVNYSLTSATFPEVIRNSRFLWGQLKPLQLTCSSPSSSAAIFSAWGLLKIFCSLFKWQATLLPCLLQPCEVVIFSLTSANCTEVFRTHTFYMRSSETSSSDLKLSFHVCCNLPRSPAAFSGDL